MAEIYRDVEIKPPEILNNKLKIKGKNGGELIIPLLNNPPISPFYKGELKGDLIKNKVGTLSVDFYRTGKIHSYDVSNYHGNSDEVIKVKLNKGKRESFLLCLVSPRNKLIEYGKLMQIKARATDKALFEYRSKTTHQFRSVKVICGEISASSNISQQ